MLKVALKRHIIGIGSEKYGKRQQQQQHGKYLDNHFRIMRITLEENIDPYVLAMLERIAEPQQKHHIVQVPLHLLQSDRACRKKVAHHGIIGYQK